MKEEIQENHRRYLQRIELFTKFGYDIQKEREFILEKVAPFTEEILEVGTGKGHFTLALALDGYSLTSVDISDEEQKYARMNIKYYSLEKKIDFRIENAEELRFSSQSFNTVFAINVFHHLSNPYKVLDEISRVVKDGGKIIISDFSKEGLVLIDKIHRSEGRKHPEGDAPVSSVKEYLGAKNFEIEYFSTILQETIVARKTN